MKKILLLLAAAGAIGGNAQQIKVASGARLSVKPGASLYFSGLTFSPSDTFILNGQSIQKDTGVFHTLNGPRVARTYRFTGNPVFSGTLRIRYRDDELNGMTESSLRMGIYNSSAWQAAPNNTVNVTGNEVVATGLSAQTLGELLLTDGVALPVLWGKLSATRSGAFVRINWRTEQERHVRHFDVERSINASSWTTAIAGIPATNSITGHDYTQTDKPAYKGQLYYRIRQTDQDGLASFSPVVTVNTGDNGTLALSPNPARDYFMLSGIPAPDITQVELLNVSGSRLKSWSGYQERYWLDGIPAGIYYLRIRLQEGDQLNRQLSVR